MTEVDQILSRISEKTDDIKSIAVQIGMRLDDQSQTLSRIDEGVMKATEDVVKAIPKPSRGGYLGIACLSVSIIASSIVAPIVGPIIIAVPVAGYALYKMSR